MRLFNQGKNDTQIGLELDRTPLSIRSHRRKTGLFRKDDTIKVLNDNIDDVKRIRDGVIYDIEIACDALLQDLKDYCDKTYPSYDIPHERPFFVFNPVNYGSMVGSPANLCSEDGSPDGQRY